MTLSFLRFSGFPRSPSSRDTAAGFSRFLQYAAACLVTFHSLDHEKARGADDRYFSWQVALWLLAVHFEGPKVSRGPKQEVPHEACHSRSSGVPLM